jgi:hypothetical protein
MSADALLFALSEVEVALEKLRKAYAEWLARDGDGDGAVDTQMLSAALVEAEERLVSARAALARAAE